MTYVNVGAYSDNQRVPSKAALKRFVKDSPELLRFDQTSALGMNSLPVVFGLDKLTDGITLSVVGPDPYNSRKWYANIVRSNGRVKVS